MIKIVTLNERMFNPNALQQDIDSGVDYMRFKSVKQNVETMS